MSQFAAPGHRPGRKGHRILRMLTEGRADWRHIMAEVGVRPDTTDQRRFQRLLASMCAAELIGAGRPGGLYFITAAGRAALAQLDSGQNVITETPATSVRVFAKEHADA